MTEDKAKQTPIGGVLVGKREGQTIIHDKGTQGGYFIGKLHKEGGIQGVNKTTGQPIEVQGGEVIITAPAVADQTKREFDGQMLTNREILSKINEKGGGVSFEQGGDVPSELYFNGSSYNYGGKTMTDYEIMQAMNSCGCEEEYKNGGSLNEYQQKIADLKRENKSTFPKVPTNKIFFNQVEVLPSSIVSTADPYLEDETKLPTESVDLKSIVPTQKNVTIPNIESTKEVELYPILFKLNDKYYVLDGHHRITNAILKDEKEVKSYVYDYKANNFKNGGLSEGKSVEDIASMHNVSVSEIEAELAKGIKVESEHTSDKKLQQKIAKDHLIENPKYYTILHKVGLEKGGQLDLVKESKKGDHTARDLNNYNDVLDMEADGLVGMDNGLAFADGGELSYAGGGATLSAEVFEWDKVPTNYRNITKVKKVPFTNNPMDKGLDSIISPFLGNDEFRPSMNGINFDENGITATNALILITLPYPNEKYNGVYDINKAKKQKSSELLLINENYPKYQNIIPDYKNAGTPYLIDVYKLLQYTKTAINYANKTTYAIAFKYGDDERVGFNGKLLSTVLTTALKLGHEKIYVFIQTKNKALVLTPNKNYELGNDDILLTMPVMLEANGVSYIEKYGTNDPDYNRSLKAYFDFNDSEIHNADGSVAEFKMQYEKNLSVDDNYLGLLSKITKKYYDLPILSYAKVEDGKMTATDLNISLIVKDVNMPNGIYEIVNKAPNITMNPIEDFPKERVFDKNEVGSRGIADAKRNTAFEFVTFSEVFEFYLDKLLLSAGKDELRPVMSGICIKKTANNELFLVTTNAHTLCKINITEYCEFEKDDRELEYILPVKYLKDFVKLADGSLHFKCGQSNIFIEADNLEYIAKAIDGKYPNYEAIIPRNNTKKIVFDHVAMNKCLQSKEFKDLTAKYKGQKDINFNIYNIENKLFVSVNESKGYSRESNTIEQLELCNINFDFKEIEKTFNESDSLFLSMNVMHTPKPNQYFLVNVDFFNVMLDTITDTEVECYFSEPSRPLCFPIDAIDYKKTLPEEKTKQQPKKVAKAKKEALNVEKEQVREAIETLLMLAEIEENEEQRKEIYEALEILNMLKENSFESGGIMSKKLTFEPIRTPLN